MSDVFDKCRTWRDYRIAQAAGLYPYHRAIEASHGSTEVDVEGRRVILACSSNFLGLAGDPRVKEAALNAVRRFGTSTSGSRMHNGTLSLHEELEEKLAKQLGAESALVVSSDYLANVAALSSLVGRNDVVVSDAHSHPSLADGVRLSFGGERRFRHQELPHLEGLLQALEPETGRMVATDAIFAHEGDLCDLPRLLELTRKHRARLLLHDSLGLGVLGENGRGTAEYFGLSGQVDLTTASLGCALASAGGVIAGESEVIQFIRHKARSVVFSNSLSAAAVAAALKALEIAEAEPQRRTRLFDIAQKMHDGLRALGFDTGVSVTPIVPVLVGDQAKCFRFWKALYEEGVLSSPVVPPLVPAGHSLLRLSFMATHSDAQLDRVLELFEKLGRKLGLIEQGAPPTFAPVALARPGSAVVANPPSSRWAASPSGDPAGGADAPDVAGARDVASRIFEAVETLTWRAANLQPDDLKRISGAPLRLWERRGQLSSLLLEKSASLLIKNDEPSEK